ncbi:MAG: helix-turn-helix domain-containing protein, partial [Erysipelotrichaceae bacterium]
MLLTKRQFEILKFLVNQYDVYISTDDLSAVFKVSSRTIKTDISYIKKYTEQFKTFFLETLRGSGIRIKVNDNENFLSEILSITSQEVPLIDYDENERVYSMLKLLINSKRYISKEEIMRKFYISESTFY